MTVREKALERLITKESYEIICEKEKLYIETLNHLNECITSEGRGVINSISESKVNEYAKISRKLLLLSEKGIDELMNMECFEL